MKLASSSSVASPSISKIPSLACAVYTRKSSEEGLEQDFNSLHAQREACEAFVLSQKSLGWNLLPAAYDDGGFSGGNVSRPGLERLIADIEAGKIKVIVVYKVDRLTRSLADFAKLVELFDSKGVSFVSVTQQFNTTTSMGRLTLNVLLSFAQFEREVTQERIRDKIAASKRKGMWMGGVPPIGYRAEGRTLVPDDVQAPRIPVIYQRYLELNCVRKLQASLEAEGWLTPARDNKRPGFGGNKPFSRGHLYRILSNPVYRGMMVHHEEVFPGMHEPILEEDLWNAVEARLEANRVGHKTRSAALHCSLLAGKITDDFGRRLVPSHSRKGHKRYRYYVTPADETGDPVRLPAQEIEGLVIKALIQWAEDDQRIVDAVGWADAKVASDAVQAGKRLAERLRTAPREHLADCLEDVQVGPQCVRIELDLIGCGVVTAGSAPEPVIIEVPAERKRCGMAVRLVVGNQAQPVVADRPNPTLVQLMNKGREWLLRLTEYGQGIGEIAKQEGVIPGYVTRLVQLALVAPDVAEAIAEGRHPMELTATALLQAMPLPEGWAEQREVLAGEIRVPLSA